jgi:hypothetical protein
MVVSDPWVFVLLRRVSMPGLWDDSRGPFHVFTTFLAEPIHQHTLFLGYLPVDCRNQDECRQKEEPVSRQERLEPVLMIESGYFVAWCHTAYLIPRVTFPLGWSVSKYA